MSEKFMLFHHTEPVYLRLLKVTVIDETALTQEGSSKIIWCFQNNETVSGKVPVITKIRN
jgi:hypothetical protein